MQLVRVRVEGATQFLNTIPITTFNEQTSGTTLGPDMAPRILGYTYNSIGTAATVVLRMSPAVGADVNDQIVLQTPAAAVNSFTEWCGLGGPIVPRLYGVQNVPPAQAPTLALGEPNNAAPFVLLFSTTSKDDDATFYVWYDYVNLGGTL